MEPTDNPQPRGQLWRARAGADGVAPLADRLARADDRDLRDEYINALGMIGGPDATRALLAALLATGDAIEASWILDTLVELMIGGSVDATDVPLAIATPPADASVADVNAFASILGEIRDALTTVITNVAWSAEAFQVARSKARDLLAAVEGLQFDADDVSFTDAQVAALLRAIDRAPAAATGESQDMSDQEPVALSESELRDLKARLALGEVVELLASVQIDESRRHDLIEGAHASIAIDIERKAQGLEVGLHCQARHDVAVNWPSITMLLVARDDDLAPPYFDTDGRVTFTIARSLRGPFRLRASLLSLTLPVPETVGRLAPQIEIAEIDDGVRRESKRSVDVTVIHQRGSQEVSVRVETRDPALDGARVRLEFFDRHGVPIDLALTDEAPIMTFALDRKQDDATSYGTWAAEMTVPEYATVKVTLFPVKPPDGSRR
jgi:hypothetical protein